MGRLVEIGEGLFREEVEVLDEPTEEHPGRICHEDGTEEVITPEKFAQLVWGAENTYAKMEYAP
jgi:hypothetical protein